MPEVDERKTAESRFSSNAHTKSPSMNYEPGYFENVFTPTSSKPKASSPSRTQREKLNADAKMFSPILENQE